MRYRKALMSLIMVVFLGAASSNLYAQEEKQQASADSQTAEGKVAVKAIENSEPQALQDHEQGQKPPSGGTDTVTIEPKDFESAEKITVDPASGTAATSIPIQVPPGRGGIEPQIALTYNSGSPNGPLGVGWSLELGKISRSTKFGVPTYTNSDTFVLMQSGSYQELVDISGNATEFRPEIEGAFMKIEFINNTHWVVTDRKGIKYYFGQDGSSRTVDTSNPGNIFAWHLDYVEDLHGNFMTIDYIKDQNACYVYKIEYTGNSVTGLLPFASVDFVYDSRIDKQINFISGFPAKTSIRINEIRVKVNGGTQRQYTLDYVQSGSTKRSLIEKITMSGLYGSVQLPSTIFEYQNQDGITDESFQGLQLDPTATGDNKWTYRFGGGYDHGHENYGPAPPPYMYFGVDWGAKQLVGDDYGNFSMSAGQDSAHWYWTYLYVDEDTTLTVPYVNGDGNPGIWLNGDVEPQNTIGSTWNLKAGYNRIDITNYHQHDSFSFNLNFDLANHVVDMHSDMIIPQFAADFNADGLDDVANFDKKEGEVKVALSAGNAFEYQETWIDNFGIEEKMFLGDFNGDALIDIGVFDKNAGNWRIAISDGTQFIDDGLWMQNFGAGEDHATGDFNADGLTDIVTFYKSSGNYYARIALNNGNNGFDEWPALDLIVCPEDATPFAVDFNGDGLMDFGSFKKSQGRWDAKLNTGNLNNDFFEIFPMYGFGNNKNMAIADFNSDGFTDIGYYDNDNGVIKFRVLSENQFSYDTEELPIQYGITEEYAHVQSADFNGDGANDFIVCGHVGYFEAAFSTSGANDLVVAVNNGVGGVTEVEYESSAYQENTFLPFPVQMAKSVTTHNSLGDSYTINYERADGLWDAVKKEFRGFSYSKVVDADGNYSESYFLQDDIFKGRLQKQETCDAAGNLYTKSENIWSSEEIYPGVNFVYLKQKDNFIFDGDSTGKRTQEQYFYEESPQYGNLIKTIQLGEVDLATGVDIPGDTRIVETEYFNNDSGGHWLLGLLKKVEVKNNAGDTMRKTWMYYDDDENQTTLPVLGLLTKKENWAGGGPGEENPITRYGYDGYGNLVLTEDPKGSQTTIIYDPDYFVFPLEIENELGHKVIKQYYGVNGVINFAGYSNGEAYWGLFGQVKSVEDPNNQEGIKMYDKFGRLCVTISPLDSANYPTAFVEYKLTENGAKIITHKRERHGIEGTLDSVQFYDGLGRLIQTKSESAYPNMFVVSGQTEYNSRGLPEKQYLPFLSTTPITEADAIDPSRPHTTITYDAMGRAVQTANPNGAYSTVIYDDWATTAINENGHKQTAHVDSYGRLISKEEYLGADGRSPFYPQTSYSLYSTTQYSYDSEGNLIQVVDAQGNITTVAYDALGRKVSMHDPDMGYWEYEYDKNGNLVWQRDAKAQELFFEYDVLNRLISKTDEGSNDVNYFYDSQETPSLEKEEPADEGGINFSIGRLQQAAYGTGNKTSFVYDEAGREISSVKKIDNQSYEINRQYDALDRLTSLVYPNQSGLIYTYNNAGQIDGIGLQSENALEKESTEDPKTIHGQATLPLENPVGLPEIQNLSGEPNFSYAELFKKEITGNSDSDNLTVSVNPLQPLKKFRQLYNIDLSWNSSSEETVIFVILIEKDSGYYYSGGWDWTDLENPGTWHGNNVFASSGAGSATIVKDLEIFNTLMGVDIQNYWWIAELRHVVPGQTYNQFNGGTYNTICQVLVDTTAAEPPEFNFVVSPQPPHPGILAQYDFDISWDELPVVPGEDFRLFYALKENISGYQNLAAQDPESGNAWHGNIDMPDDQSTGAHAQPKELIAYDEYNGNTISEYVWMAELRRVHPGRPYDPLNSWSFFTPISLEFPSQAGTGLRVQLSTNHYHPMVDHEDSYEISFAWTDPIPTFNSDDYDYKYYFTIFDKDSMELAALDAQGNFWQEEGFITNGNSSTISINKNLTIVNNENWQQNTNTFVWHGEIRRYPKGNTADYISLVHCDGVVPGKDLGDQILIRDVLYNTFGQVTEIEYGNGTTTTYNYDPQTLRLDQLVTINPQGVEIQNLTYDYDSIGNITSIIDVVNTDSQNFSYDALNRLIEAQGSYGVKTYSYDAIGNILQKDGKYYTYGENNAGPHAVTSLSDGTTFSYDDNGNMVSMINAEEENWQYIYDKENRLIEVKKGLSLKARFEYDGDSGRTKKITYQKNVPHMDTGLKNEIFDPGRFNPDSGFTEAYHNIGIAIGQKTTRYVGSLYEQSASVGIKYIFLGDRRIASVQNGEITYYFTNHLGSTNVATDAVGEVKELCEYEPFGLFSRHEMYENSAQVAHFYFTGKPLDDETGLYYYGARYYNPTVGRFLTADSVAQNPGGDPQTLNRYSYCGNNPVIRVDPDGHFWWIIGAIIGAVAGGISAHNNGGNIFQGILIGGVMGALSGATLGASAETLRGIGQGIFLLRGSAATSLASQVANAIPGGQQAGKYLGYSAMAMSAAFTAWNAGVGIKDWAVGRGQYFDAQTGAGMTQKEIIAKYGEDGASIFSNGVGMTKDQALAMAERHSDVLLYNPTHGSIADFVESGLGLATGTESISRQLGNLATQMKVSLVGYSQGTIVSSNALLYAAAKGGAVSGSTIKPIASVVGGIRMGLSASAAGATVIYGEMKSLDVAQLLSSEINPFGYIRGGIGLITTLGFGQHSSY